MNASFYLPKTKEGKIVAFADVDLANGIIVKGFRIVRSDDGLFAAVPSRSFTAQGKTKWLPQVVFSNGELRKQFLSALLDDYQRWEREPVRASGGEKPGSEPPASHPPANELVE